MSDKRLIEAALDRVTEACLKDGCADMFKKLMDGVAKGSRDQKEQLAAERAKVQSLSEVIESQKQTHDALINKCRELEAQNLELFDKAVNSAWLETQNAAMREALEELVDLVEGIPDGSYWPDSFTCQPARKALSLAPSDAAEMVLVPKEPTFEMRQAGSQETMEKDDGTFGKATRVYKAMIEAARAAGVTTEGNQ